MYLSFLLRQLHIQLHEKSAGIRKHNKKLKMLAAVLLIAMLILSAKGMIERNSVAHKKQSPAFYWPGSAVTIAKIAGIAAITSGSIYAVYRKNQKAIKLLPILTKKEDEK